MDTNETIKILNEKIGNFELSKNEHLLAMRLKDNEAWVMMKAKYNDKIEKIKELIVNINVDTLNNIELLHAIAYKIKEVQIIRSIINEDELHETRVREFDTVIRKTKDEIQSIISRMKKFGSDRFSYKVKNIKKGSINE